MSNRLIDRPLVLAVVGTDHHPFDRLVGWMDDWARRHPDVRCLVQHGKSRPPVACAGVDYLPHARLQEEIARASVVVSHGGPATITDVRRTGLVPLVLPRDPARVEHVDSHQQRFAAVLAERGMVRVVDTAAELDAAIAAAIRLPRPRTSLEGPEARAAAMRLAGLVDQLLAGR